MQDVLAPLLHIVFRTDADGEHAGLRPHHMLHGGDEFRRQSPVRDDHEADHVRNLTGPLPRRARTQPDAGRLIRLLALKSNMLKARPSFAAAEGSSAAMATRGRLTPRRVSASAS